MWGLLWTIYNVIDTIYHLLPFFSNFLTISIDFWNFLLAFRLFSYFGPFLSIFEAFYHPSGSSRPILDHFSWFLTVFTALRAISDLFWAFSIDFWGKKCQICPKLVQNFPKRASKFYKGSKSIEKKQKNKKEPQKVSKKVQKLQKWS